MIEIRTVVARGLESTGEEGAAGKVFRRGLLLAAVNAVLLVGVGCWPNSVTIVATHWPLYEAVLHQTTIAAKATSSFGISQVNLVIIKGEMVVSLDASTPSSIIPLRKNAVTFTKSCSFPMKPKEAECSYTDDFGDKAMVSYTAEAISSLDEREATPEITFASGYPPVAEVMRPVWWHRKNTFDEQIDLCLYPDKDYKGDYLKFTQELSEMISWVLFRSTPEYSFHYSNVSLKETFANLTNTYRFLFSFWAAPFGADSKDVCPLCGDPDFEAMAAVADGNAILHLTEFRDWGTAQLGGGVGTVEMPSMIDARGAAYTLLHESGHFMHRLSDECCCDGGYRLISSNVFASEAACKQAAKGQKFDQTLCKEIAVIGHHTGVWHLNSPGEIMGYCGEDAYQEQQDWYNFTRLSWQYRFGHCLLGKCY